MEYGYDCTRWNKMFCCLVMSKWEILYTRKVIKANSAMMLVIVSNFTPFLYIAGVKSHLRKTVKKVLPSPETIAKLQNTKVSSL